MRRRPSARSFHRRVAGPRRGHRQPVGDAAGRLHQAGGVEVGQVQHHARAKLRKPAPRSGSMTMVAVDGHAASPSSSGRPASQRCPARRRPPTPGPARAARFPAGRRGAGQLQRAAQRVALAHRLDAASRVAPPCVVGRAGHAGKVALVTTTLQPMARALASISGGVGLSLLTTASPPSSWRASRARPGSAGRRRSPRR